MPNMDPKKCPMPSQEPNVRNKNFKEVALGYTEEMAVNEAKRCLQCKNHPCRTDCPVEIDIPGFIKHVAEGDFEAAYNVINSPARCPPSAAVSARRSISARASVSAASRARLSASAVWSALSPTGTATTSTPSPLPPRPTAIKWLLSAQAHPA